MPPTAADDHRSDPAEIELSVVIPMYNAAGTIAAQLEALLKQEWSGSWEIVVADNGSTDSGRDVVEMIARYEQRLRLIDASGRRGPAHARNLGATAARGALLAFCDADDVVMPGWVAAIGDTLRRAPAVTGPQLQDQLNPPWMRNVYGSRIADSPQTFAGVFPFGASANLGMRRDVFTSLGGFDPTIEVGEDIELCLRLWRAGHELIFAPHAAIQYRNRASLSALWRQAVQYGATAPMIVRLLRTAGVGVHGSFSGWRNWTWLVRRLPILRMKSGRARWLVVAGGSIGRLIGSLRQRTIYI